MPITVDTTLTAQALANYTDDYRWSGQPGCAPFGTFSPDRTYRVIIPVGQRITVTVNPNGNWDPSLQIASVCTAGTMNTCLAGQNDSSSNVPEVLVFANPGSTVLDTFIVVDTSSGVASITPFDITVAFSAIPVGEVCGSAEVLTLPANRAADTLVSYGNDYVSGAGCASGTTGPDRVYRVTAPANARLTATVTASTNTDGGVAFAPTVNFVPATTCAPTLTCLGGANSVSSPGFATARFDNATGTTRDLFVVVDTSTSQPGGTFSLSVTSTPTTFPVGDLCSNAGAPITMSTTLQNESFVGSANQYFPASQNVCQYLTGVDRAYAVTIPSGQLLTATAIGTDAGVLPDGGFMNLSLSIVPAGNECQSGPCVAGVNATTAAGGREVTSRSNPGVMAEQVLVVVDSNLPEPAPAGTFSLDLALTTPPAGDTCNDAQPPITASVSLGMEDLAGYQNDYSGFVSGCAFENGEDRTYRIIIPANFRLTATTVTTSDHALSLVAGPAANCAAPTSCLASADAIFTGGGETLTFNNTSMNPVTAFLVVDRFGTTGTTPYSLTIDLTAIPAPAYTRTVVAGSCDMLSGPTVVLGSMTTPAIGDDVASDIAALPFTFNFFGAPVTHFTATTNGFMQFYGSSTGTGSTTFGNVAIPNIAAPNGFAAPFWDDLNVSAMGSVMHSQVFGTAPNRSFTMEWSNMTRFGVSGTLLTFQVKVFETTNVIEFHYCSLSGTGSDGLSATIGLENATGSEGVQHSFNTASSVSPMNGLRFTP